MSKYFRVFLKYKNLILYLAKTQISLKYRKSYLGLLWSLLNPLLTMVILTMVFSGMFKNNIENFPIYLMCGRLIFEYNSEATKTAMNAVISNSSLIKKIYVPKYVFPLSSSIAALVNMFFSLIALLIVMIATKLTLKWTMLFIWLPMLYVFIFSTGLGLILASANVFFRDTKHLYGVFITLWMYLTPLFYPIESVSERTRSVIEINPLYHFIKMFRGMMLDGVLPTFRENVICLSLGLVMVTIGLISFKKCQDKFILHI
ncbi:MAG: ABC transporter permease [Ruminococcus sp.]|nr:ABC transporter permease [Ruminococcus sp.]